MKIHRITAHAGCTFNHPYEAYSNFRFGMTIEAEPEGNENCEEIAAALHSAVQAEIEAQKQSKLEELHYNWENEQTAGWQDEEGEGEA